MDEELQSKIWQLERQVFQLRTLFEVAQALNRCRQPDELYSRILAIMAGTFGARESLALQFDHGVPVVAAYRGSQEQVAEVLRERLPASFPQASIRQQKQLIGEALGESGADQDFTLWEWIEVQNQPVGGLYFGKKILGEPYNSNDEALLRAVCSYAAHVLENITLYQQLRRAHERLAAENLVLKQKVRQQALSQEIIGQSRPIEQLRQLILNYGRSEAPVLITGETGTGKELVARAIHEASARSNGPFVAINCAAIPDNLVESEFFGIEEGVATGVKRRIGYFEQAHTGTLFIDEIGDMPPGTQVKLLRALQEGVVRRIGGQLEIPVDVRIVTATNQT
ncbi:MAG: sigma 54-interacting transcriptional regulator [candidate division KSB1 bacterium]|nr:sigma 54-interacting transcriptional regulator [candidate division KSB1 bacterium]